MQLVFVVFPIAKQLVLARDPVVWIKIISVKNKERVAASKQRNWTEFKCDRDFNLGDLT